MDLSTTQTVVGLLISTVLPILVGLVTTRITSPQVQATVLLVLTAANGFLNEWHAAGSSYNLARGVLYWIVSLVTAIAVHFGVWKPLGVARKAQDSLRTAPAPRPAPPEGV